MTQKLSELSSEISQMGFLSFMDLLIPDFDFVSIPSSKGFLFVCVNITVDTFLSEIHAHVFSFFDMMLL